MKRAMAAAVCLCGLLSGGGLLSGSGLLGAAAWAQEAGPSQADLDEAVRQGTVAALAPLCGLRDEAWSFDLRRAELSRASRGTRVDDAALADAPGRKLMESALSFAEDEALEAFAQAPPAKTCGPLASGPALGEADAEVRAFRARKALSKPSS